MFGFSGKLEGKKVSWKEGGKPQEFELTGAVLMDIRGGRHTVPAWPGKVSIHQAHAALKANHGASPDSYKVAELDGSDKKSYTGPKSEFEYFRSRYMAIYISANRYVLIYYDESQLSILMPGSSTPLLLNRSHVIPLSKDQAHRNAIERKTNKGGAYGQSGAAERTPTKDAEEEEGKDKKLKKRKRKESTTSSSGSSEDGSSSEAGESSSGGTDDTSDKDGSGKESGKGLDTKEKKKKKIKKSTKGKKPKRH